MRKLSSAFVFKATCVLLVFLVFGQVSLFFLCRCGRILDEDVSPQFRERRDTIECPSNPSLQEMEALNAQVQQLKRDIAKQIGTNTAQATMITSLEHKNRELSLLLAAHIRVQKATITQEIPTTRASRKSRDFLNDGPLLSEFEVVPFDSVSYNAIYQLSEGLSRNPAERPMPRGPKGKDYNEVIQFATNNINEEFEHEDSPTMDFDLFDGIMRIDRQRGSEYDLYFQTPLQNIYRRIRVQRQFQPLQIVGNVETIDTNQETINIIIPLSGRLDKFKIFMSSFVNVCILWDKRIFLTVVFFGEEGRNEIQELLSNVSKKENFTSYKILLLDEPFSRGLGLQKGVLDWDKGNVLMLFCDVDIYFTPEFLEKCRFYTNPGHQVYYPILFSLYNPVVVYGGSAPPLNQQFRVNRETGYWRDYGFGMSCQYRSDFLKTGGFDLSIRGWGMEDVKLYRQYLSSSLTVIRAVDKNIFHIYHHKHCNRTLSEKQYISCINSKVKSEASHTQLGLLAFGGKIFSNEDPNWVEQLQKSAVNKSEPDITSMPKGETADVLTSTQEVKTTEQSEALELRALDKDAAQALLNRSNSVDRHTSPVMQSNNVE